jgi:streptogramin lyase
MRRLIIASVIGVIGTAGLAQETYWVANRFSNNLHGFTPWGSIQTVAPTTTNLRRVVQAPDGKLWIVRFIQSTVDIFDANGNPITSVVNATGNVYDIAFDRFGHAWVSGGSSVHEYDANGTPVAAYPLAALAPLGISVDMDGNKWIAHRISPGSISRIDALTGAVTNHLLPASPMLPTLAYSDYRGLGSSSHIWVIGDSSGNVAEFDSTGTALNLFSSTLSSISSLTQDPQTSDLFIGSFSNGAIARMTTAGVVSSTFTNSPNVLGLTFDSFGRLLVTTRVSFSGPQPCEVRRYDILTTPPTLEVVSTVGLGTQSASTTRRDFALVVDPAGDADSDGDLNYAEILAGTSPWDAQSNAFTSLNTIGATASGSTFYIDIKAPSTAMTFIAVSAGTTSPGLTAPGVNGLFLLDLATLVLNPSNGSPIFFTTAGPTQLPVTIPPAVGGAAVTIQGLTLEPSFNQFTNVSGVFVYI